MTRALYPGTFDPITNGHVDIVKRASRLFDTLTVAVAAGTHKDAAFPLTTRRKLVEESVASMKKVEVITLSGLLAEQCRRLSFDVVIRGLRAVSDFEYEMMMALMNRKLYPKFETVFLMPSLSWVYLSSSIVKDAASHGGDVSGLVPEIVIEALNEKYPRK